MIKSLTIIGKDYRETFDVTPDNDMVHRVDLSVELHNRDNPDDLWTVEIERE